MDFSVILPKSDEAPMPYAGKTADGKWLEGTISVTFLQETFGHCATLDECIAATDSEGLKLFFEDLKK